MNDAADSSPFHSLVLDLTLFFCFSDVETEKNKQQHRKTNQKGRKERITRQFSLLFIFLFLLFSVYLSCFFLVYFGGVFFATLPNIYTSSLLCFLLSSFFSCFLLFLILLGLDFLIFSLQLFLNRYASPLYLSYLSYSCSYSYFSCSPSCSYSCCFWSSFGDGTFSVVVP